MNTMFLYFAYGSNMNPTRMSKRCPGAIDLGGAVLRNHRVAERLYADIDFIEGEETDGVLYVITEEHLRKLDRYAGYLSVYRRIWVDVEFEDCTYQAITYEMAWQTNVARDRTITGTLYDTGYGFPAFVPEGENTVAAELIEIPFEDWEAVDRLEGYPRLCDRLMFPAKLEDGTEVSG